MLGCCGCCSALRPRYKRLVDSIFPVNRQDGLVKGNMEKLTFYAMSSPEKLDRIGEYLLQRVSRDISRHRYGYVTIAVEALDKLLVACHAQQLNLFVESYLKMVQKLLECTDPELQLLSTQSFVKFANIEEDTPSYHRRYDFFVSKFSSLCHSNIEAIDVRCRLRVAGLKGLQGVVRKTVSDDLQVNIWDKMHMDKIIPSLLFNMQDSSCGPITMDVGDGPSEENSPSILAEACLRELTGRITFGNIKAVLNPVLKHLDNHELWVPNDFSVNTFKAIMYSIKSQYSYDVVQILLSHLGEHAKDNPKIRTGMVDVLSKIISIAANESVGPSVVGTVNSLLTHLRLSIDCKSHDNRRMRDEKLFQEAVIHTLGEFVQSLPDYQKIEIMMFILGKTPIPDPERPIQDDDVLVQTMLLKSLLKVGTKYTSVYMMTTFQQPFLDPLLRISQAPNPDIRLLVQQILHTLIDRHNNLPKLLHPSLNIDGLELSMEKCSRQDLMFMRKSGQDFYLCVYNIIQCTNNQMENLESLFCTLSLLIVELFSEDSLIDIIRLGLAIQELMFNVILPERQKFAIHSMLACLFNLLGYLTEVTGFGEYVKQVIKRRQEECPLLVSGYTDAADEEFPDTFAEGLLFDRNCIIDTFGSSNQNTSRLQTAFIPRHSSETMSVARSLSELNSISVEVDSVSSSPGVTRKHPEEEITVESIKKMMAEPLNADRQAEEARRLQIVEQYRTAAFEELVTKSEAKTDQLQNKLNEIFGKISNPSLESIASRAPGSPHPSAKVDDSHKILYSQPIYEMHFPDLFVI